MMDAQLQAIRMARPILIPVSPMTPPTRPARSSGGMGSVAGAALGALAVALSLVMQLIG